MYIKKILSIVLVIIFFFMTCHLVSLGNKNKRIEKNLESRIISNIDRLNGTVKDLKLIKTKSDTSYAKELCAITLFAFDEYDVVNSKREPLYYLGKLVAAYQRNIYIIDENGINDEIISKLEAIGKYLELFQDSDVNDFNKKVKFFNEKVYNDEMFENVTR
ncbi:MAG: hypothetical protein IJ423_05320 [Clostridia bacterium]|nr:hypothetical protein [Clostridia bacterium]MBQ8637389.1 hypothetical protein [Clostridia bacterium]